MRPPTVTATTCRSCGTRVWFLRHERTGTVTPIETEPAPKGDIAVDLDRGTWRVVRQRSKRQAPDGPLHMAHFATCTEAGNWRRRP